ncbi:uncharacterized protein LOC129229266 [Uloborus diversus]|uniref:uncharacterized protein LOC129229266 n=1 Tax=Uloborus diversus TaxID=327109 RepID=UPI002408FEB3|nr:uncharacterized protein LOC129229266 [Uloborus diversus]
MTCPELHKSRKFNSRDSRTKEENSSSGEYETDSSSNSDSEEHETKADKSKGNYYQEKILRNKRKQQEIMKLIQLNEAKQDFVTALDEIIPKRKKTLNKKREKKIYEGPLRKSDRHKDKTRKNLSMKRMFAHAFSLDSDEMEDDSESDDPSHRERKSTFVVDFLIPALNQKTYGDLLMWDPFNPTCFLLKNTPISSSSWSPEQSAVSTAWDQIRGRGVPNSRLDFYNSKKRLSAVLTIAKNIQNVKRVGRYRRYKILNLDDYKVHQDFQLNCPTNGNKNIPLVLKKELEAEKRKRNLRRKGIEEDSEWDNSDDDDLIDEPLVLEGIDSKNARRSSRLKDTKVNYSLDDLFTHLYGNPEMERSQTDENKITVRRVKKRVETFHPEGSECSERPKVLLCRLPQTEVSKYCHDVEVKQEQTDENKMTVRRIKKRVETFHPEGSESSEWPKVLLCRLPQTEVSKYCHDVEVKQEQREEKEMPRRKVKQTDVSPEISSTKSIS